MRNEYNLDFQVEGIISRWLEKHYFKKYSNNYQYFRNYNTTYQKAGVDSVLINRKIFNDYDCYCVDEKAASSYIKMNINDLSLPTFAFELDCKRHKGSGTEDRVEGWLFGDQYSKTEYYLISWVWADVEGYKGKGKKELVDLDNIQKVESFLIKKEKIHDYLEKVNLTKNNFISWAKKAREKKGDKIVLSKDSDKKTPNLHYSVYLKEQPVNVIISKSDLRDLATDTFIVEA